MQQVRFLLEGKGDEVYSIDPDAPVLDAITVMAERRVGALVVLRDGELVGVISERDYARKVILQGRSSAQTAVSEIMSAPAITVMPENTVDECMRLCTDSRIRHLPVTDGTRVIGMISIGDLVKAVIDEQALQIDQLQRYIAS